MEELLSPAEVERLAAKAGLTIKEVCDRARISHTTFYRWRQDETKLTLKTYRAICEVLRQAAEAAD